MAAKPLPHAQVLLDPNPLHLKLVPDLEDEGVSIVPPSHLQGGLVVIWPPFLLPSHLVPLPRASLEGNEVGTGGLSGSGFGRES